MDVEHSFSNEELEHIQLELLLLAKSSIPLIDAVRDALKHASKWSMRLNKDRSFYKANKAMRGEDFKRANARVVELLGKEIDAYRSSGRMSVLEPYKVSDSGHRFRLRMPCLMQDSTRSISSTRRIPCQMERNSRRCLIEVSVVSAFHLPPLVAC